MSKKKPDHVGGMLAGVMSPEFARQSRAHSDSISAMYYAHNLRVLSDLSQSLFDYDDLPETMSARYIERQLFYKGCVILIQDSPSSTNKPWALSGAGVGQRNHAGEHTSYEITEPNWHGIKRWSSKSAVPMFANTSRVPTLLTARLYAEELTELDMSIRVATKNSRRSRVIVADQDQRVGMANVNDAIDRGDAVIFLDRPLDKGAISALDMNVPAQEIIDLHTARQRIWGEAMTVLGVNNSNMDKRERQIVDEVNANNDQVEAMRAVALDERREALRLFNKRHHYDITVKFKDVGSSGIPEPHGAPTNPTTEIEGE